MMEDSKEFPSKQDDPDEIPSERDTKNGNLSCNIKPVKIFPFIAGFRKIRSKQSDKLVTMLKCEKCLLRNTKVKNGNIRETKSFTITNNDDINKI